MTRKNLKTGLAAAVALCLVTLLFLFWSDTPLGRARAVNKLVDQNVAARGGDEPWRDVSSLRLTGQMDVGKGMSVPYVLEQKRPSKMRLEFVFEGETAVQCSDGKAGWKLEPFRGRTTAEPMTEEELRELFEQHGPTVSVRVITDRETGRSRGFGFVEFDDAANADKALAALDGQEMGGRPLRVNEAQDRQRGGGRR